MYRWSVSGDLTLYLFLSLQTFDECVQKDGSDCDAEHLWLQIPFFCGQDAECWYVVKVTSVRLVSDFCGQDAECQCPTSP